jgi:RTX calcium-binding nonapeptide repeat (4 copies)
MAEFTGTGDADHFLGTDGIADSFRFEIGNLSSADTVAGGAGVVIDSLVITTIGTLLPRAWRGVSGIERIVFEASGSDLLLTDARLSLNNVGGRLAIVGSTGSDKINASDLSAAFAVSFEARDGDDSFTGGRGADNVLVGSAQLTSLDHFAGKRGFDTLTISSGNVIASQLTGVTGFEKLALAKAGSLTIDNSFAAANEAGRLLTLWGSSQRDAIDGRTVAHAHSLAISGLAGKDRLLGGAGNDTISGGSGNDTIKGGAGSDTIAGDEGSDVLAGGRGNDLVTIAGDFADYTLSRLPDGRLRIADDSGHADILAKDIERLSFDDRAFDLKAPPPPTVTAISDDSGSSSADFVTSDPSLIISGTADPSMG